MWSRVYILSEEDEFLLQSELLCSEGGIEVKQSSLFRETSNWLDLEAKFVK